MDLSQAFFKNLIDSLYDGVYILDRERRITYWNKAAERLSGYRAEEVVGKRCRDQILMHVDDRGNSLCDATTCPAARVMQEGEKCEAEIFLHHKKGHRVPVVTRVAPIRDEQGSIIGVVEIFNENSASLSAREKIAELKKLALLDPLTQLGNRRYAESVLYRQFDELKMYGWTFGLIFMDLDEFKAINDHHGHIVGDEVLRMVATTLGNSVRSMDTVCRWGGDEFVAIIEHIDSEEVLSQVGNKCRLLVEKSSIRRGNEVIQIGLSIGATLSKEADDVDSLLRRADRLMYHSKQEGGNRITLKLPA
jgi:diguanylate cyclase (GGDEF)-like protein/PAS domain S-box-containing protein